MNITEPLRLYATIARGEADSVKHLRATTTAADDVRLVRAHHVIDRFEALTGIKAEAEPVPAEVTTAAIAAMTA